MKFWQLVSICKELKLELDEVETAPDTERLARWYRDFDAIVNRQDRHILDYKISDELCLKILSESKSSYYLSQGYLRKRPLSDDDQLISVQDIVSRFGGAALEQMFESGLVSVE